MPNSDKAHSAPAWDITETRRIVTKGLRDYPVDIYLFGSRANGTAGRCSDIDVAVLSHTRLPEGLLTEIREALEESHILYRVDLVDLSQANEVLRKRVLQEGIRWNA
jgi:predicted nucleotidyltransferase